MQIQAGSFIWCLQFTKLSLRGLRRSKCAIEECFLHPKDWKKCDDWDSQAVWPDLAKFKHFGKFWKSSPLFASLFSIWRKIEQFLWYWANFHCFTKWSNIENRQAIWSHCSSIWFSSHFCSFVFVAWVALCLLWCMYVSRGSGCDLAPDLA